MWLFGRRKKKAAEKLIINIWYCRNNYIVVSYDGYCTYSQLIRHINLRKKKSLIRLSDEIKTSGNSGILDNFYYNPVENIIKLGNCMTFIVLSHYQLVYEV